MGLITGNLSTGRHQACRVKSELNLTYAGAVNHYGIAVIPARIRRPKDKAKIEGGGDCPHLFILAGLRQCTFFSLAVLAQRHHPAAAGAAQ